MDLSAKQFIEEKIALHYGRFGILRQHQRGFQACRGRRGRGHPGMVRLRRPRSDEHGCASGECIADEKFQLAGLVAAERESRQVIALDENPGTRLASTKFPPEAAQFVKRRGKSCEPEARL